MFAVALVTSTLLALADARIYERCELAQDLLSLGISKEHLATWVCIAFHESRFDTAAHNPHSGDYGILQISELYWCGFGKACGLPCSALRDEDISDDVECALRIYEEHTRLQGNGFLAWVVYPHHCKHNAKKYLVDCDSSVKTSSVRTDNRARFLKSRNRTSSTSFNYNPKIDELLPPYLAINTFLRGTYEKEFENNYNSKVRTNWLNFKIDNIDELKLPVFNQKSTNAYVTSTVTTTTTTPSTLPNIKPPSPRRIETNQFRRRIMKSKSEPLIPTAKTNPPTQTTQFTTTTSAPSNIYKPLIANNTKSEITQSGVIFTTTFRPITENVKLHSVFTTKQPTTYHSYNQRTTLAQNQWTKINNETSSAITESASTTIYPTTPKLTTKFIPVSLSNDNLWSTPSPRIQNKPSNKSLINSSITLTSTLSPLSVNNTLNKKLFNFERHELPLATTTSRSYLAWRISPNRSYITTPKSSYNDSSSITKTSQESWRTAKSWSNNLSKTFNGSSTTSTITQSTTSNPLRTTRNYPETTLVSPRQPNSNINSGSTRSSLVDHTTSKPRIWPPSNSRTTPASATPRSTVTSTTTSATTPSPSTARTTQSIFDLYLNPTKRPKIPVYSFPSFKNSPLSVRIFASGTTTPSPFLISKDSKTTPGDAAKNQIRRQT